MNCKSVKNHLPRYLDYDLPDDVLKGIGLHLVDCEACQSELKAYEESLNVLRQLGDQPMTAPAMESLQHSIRRKVQRRTVRSVANRAMERTAWNPKGVWGITLAAAMLILLMSAGFLVYLEHYWAQIEPQEIAAAVGNSGQEPKPDSGESVDQMLSRLARDAAAALDADLDEVLYPVESVHEAWQYDFPASLKSLEPPTAPEPAPPPDGVWAKPVRASLVKF